MSDINPKWKWTMLLEDLVNRSKRGSNIYHRVMSPSETVEVVPSIAYEQVVKERDEARAELTQAKARIQDACRDFMNERAKSAKLLKALKLECCCTGERKEYEPYDYITCDACDAVAEYESGKPKLRTAEEYFSDPQTLETSPTESKKLFDDETFYNLMQTYRHTPFIDQEAVTKAFNEVKDYVLELAGYTIGRKDE